MRGKRCSDASTIAGAAATRHVSQSTIALALGELERALGVQLFLRHKAKGLTITQAGLAVLTDTRSLLGRADELLSSAQSLGRQLSDKLTIGCYTTLARS